MAKKKIQTSNFDVSAKAEKVFGIPHEETKVFSDTDNTELKVKALGLFDHLKQVTQGQDKRYFDKITDADKRTWNNYMINRFLSMEPELLELVNETQKFTVGGKMPPECMYKMLIDLIPKSKIYLQYVKGKNENKYNDELVSIVKIHFMVSKAHAKEYIDILHRIGRIQDLKDLMSRYGYEDDEIQRIVV